MKFIRRILVLLYCLSSVLNCVPAIATEVHDGFNLYQQRFGSYYSIHDILKKSCFVMNWWNEQNQLFKRLNG